MINTIAVSYTQTRAVQTYPRMAMEAKVVSALSAILKAVPFHAPLGKPRGASSGVGVSGTTGFGSGSGWVWLLRLMRLRLVTAKRAFGTAGLWRLLRAIDAHERNRRRGTPEVRPTMSNATVVRSQNNDALQGFSDQKRRPVERKTSKGDNRQRTALEPIKKAFLEKNRADSLRRADLGRQREREQGDGCCKKGGQVSRDG